MEEIEGLTISDDRDAFMKYLGVTQDEKCRNDGQKKRKFSSDERMNLPTAKMTNKRKRDDSEFNHVKK